MKLVKTDPLATSYGCYFNGSFISPDDQQYEGSTTDTLVIKECHNECKGFYTCKVTDRFVGKYNSEDANLEIGRRELLELTPCMSGSDFYSGTNIVSVEVFLSLNMFPCD